MHGAPWMITQPWQTVPDSATLPNARKRTTLPGCKHDIAARPQEPRTSMTNSDLYLNVQTDQA
eukprot:8525839-Alexandrium_andersonii.AAC.1